MEGIRKSIQEDRFLEYKKEFLDNYSTIDREKKKV
jgi:queuine/archaeosine tRNA-ribosyltransferase